MSDTEITKDFAGVPIRFTRRGDGTCWVDSAQVSVALGYYDRSTFLRLCRKHAQELAPHQGVAVLTTPSAADGRGGGEQKVTIIEEHGVYLLACLARTPRGAEFRAFVAEVFTQLRRGHLELLNAQQAELRAEQVRLRDRAEVAEAHLQDARASLRLAEHRAAQLGIKPAPLPPVAQALVDRARLAGSLRLTAAEVAVILETTPGRLAKLHPRPHARFRGTRKPYHVDDVRRFLRGQQGDAVAAGAAR